ncbi:MAG: TolC family protein [Chitinophagaceae bacterium]
MLVNIRKLLLIFLILVGKNTLQAQEAWTLAQCVDTAQVHNKSLQINRNIIALGEQREKEAKANLIPKIAVNADYKYFTDLPHQLMPLSTFNPTAPEGQFKDAQFGVPHNINANLQLAMPLYNQQLHGAIHNTKLASKLTELQYQKTEEQVLYDVTTLYYNAQILIHQLSFLDSNLINTNKLSQNMQLLHEQLVVKGTDVNKVKLQAEQLKTQKEKVSNKYVQILNALKLNMGIALSQSVSVENDIQLQVAKAYSPNTILDLQIVQTQNKLLNTELSTLNKSKYIPSLNLIASYGTSGFGYNKSPNEFLNFYPIGFAGIQLNYPLFNGTVTQRKIYQKRLEIINNDLQSQLISEKNKMEIENANRQRAVAQKTVANTDDQIQLAHTIYEQTILQLKQGTATLTDVLLADNALREAQQNYLSATIDYLKADLDLRKLSGNMREN